MTNVSYQWMLRLNRGDSVKLRVIVGKLYVDEIDQVHFTGQLHSGLEIHLDLIKSNFEF